MRYRSVLKAIRDTPWAMEPEAFASILEVVYLRAQGVQLDEDEIKRRIEAADHFHAEEESQRRATLSAQSGPSVVVLPIYGLIAPKSNLMTHLSGGTSLQSFNSALNVAANDPQVQAIVLDVDSPGGSVELVPETGKALLEARERKPIYAVANTKSASAAYWLASQASEFYVSPSGQVGSIGVYTAHDDLSGAMEKAGVKTTLISAGKFKTEGNPFGPLSAEAKAQAQGVVDAYYEMFLSAVAEGRGAEKDVVREGFGQGRMVLAADAVKAGMVDGEATLEQVIGAIVHGEPVVALQPAAQTTTGSANYNLGAVRVEDEPLRGEQVSDFLKQAALGLGLAAEATEDEVLAAIRETPRPEPEPDPETAKAQAFAEQFPEEAARLARVEEENKAHRVDGMVKSLDEGLRGQSKALTPTAYDDVKTLLTSLSEEAASEVSEVMSAVLQDGLVDLTEKGSSNGHKIDASEALEARASEIAAAEGIPFREALTKAIDEDPDKATRHVGSAPVVTSDEEA